MIYNDLNKIPLQRFIDVFCGNIRALIMSGNHSDEELALVAQDMVYSYTSIVGGMQILAEIEKKNEVLNLSTKIECMSACENLMKIGMISDVCHILKKFGYSVKEDDPEKIQIKISGIIGSSRFRLDSINSHRQKTINNKVDKSSFVKERVILMQHYKMHIDPLVFTAGEYAYLVKCMCDEVNNIASKNLYKK